MQREKKIEKEVGVHSYLVSYEREIGRGGRKDMRNRDGDTPTPRVSISRIMMTVLSLVVVERTRSPHVWVTTWPRQSTQACTHACTHARTHTKTIPRNESINVHASHVRSRTIHSHLRSFLEQSVDRTYFRTFRERGLCLWDYLCIRKEKKKNE